MSSTNIKGDTLGSVIVFQNPFKQIFNVLPSLCQCIYSPPLTRRAGKALPQASFGENKKNTMQA